MWSMKLTAMMTPPVALPATKLSLLDTAKGEPAEATAGPNQSKPQIGTATVAMAVAVTETVNVNVAVAVAEIVP